MSNFSVEQGRTRVNDEAYYSYVEKVNPRRTQLVGKRAISGWKLIRRILLETAKMESIRYMRRINTSYAFDHIPFDTALRQPVSGPAKAATNVQHPASSGEYRQSDYQQLRSGSRRLFCLLLGLIIILIPGAVAIAALQADDVSEFRGAIQKLSTLGDRSTGTSGNQAAAAYIKSAFERLGFETTGSQKFSVPVIHTENSSLTLSESGMTVPIQAVHGNAITPQTIAPPGISAPLIYVGNGDFKKLNGKAIQGSIVLMELESGKNWLTVADLGAVALIYVDRGESSKLLFEEKYELSPIQFPRFWMPIDRIEKLFPGFEKKPDGLVAERVRLASDAKWKSVIAENIYCVIPGSDPELQEQAVMVEAFYDSTVWVAGLSPGADEACSVATLLYLAKFFKENPPLRTIIMVATSGHAQALAGIRELVWSYTTRSKIQRKMRRDLKSMIKKIGNTVQALKEVSFEGAITQDPEEEEREALVKEALEERVKTESDRVSRRLMQLRLQEVSTANQMLIKELASERQLLRQLLWKPSYTDLTPEEQRVLEQLIPKTIADQNAILSDARQQLDLLNSARAFRGQIKIYDMVTAVSLHLSSHGDGFGAFNYGWQYPFRPRINRTAIYSTLDEVLRQGALKVEKELGYQGLYKDTMRPSRRRSWQSYFLDQPPLGGEVTAMTGTHGLTFVTTHDARAMWGTPNDTPENVDYEFARRQTALVAGLIRHLAQAPKLHDGLFPRVGISEINGNAKFLRHGELFADQPAPGTVLLGFQGPAKFYAIVDHLGKFHLRGLADKKHSYHKIIFEGFKFDETNGSIIWAIDKKQTGKPAYRTKMFRRHMETDLIMFACKSTTLFHLLEPRTFRYLHKSNLIDGRREADPLRYWFSRLDTWITSYRNASNITTVFLEPGTPLKMTLSDSVLRKKMILLNADESNPKGEGYLIEKWPALNRTAYKVARDMWALLTPRVDNLEKRGIFNERIRKLQQEGQKALNIAKTALGNKQYDQFYEGTARSWALASRVYDDVEKTQKDVLYGVLFYIALFVPFAFCLERLLFSYSNIYKRIIAFSIILILLIAIIYNVHPAFRLAYSPMVVILAFFIMGLSLIVTLIIYFRFEEEMVQLQTRAQLVQSGEIGRWKAFVAAFLLDVTNARLQGFPQVL